MEPPAPEDLPARFLAYLRGAGFEVKADGDGRLWVLPRERLTAAEAEQVRGHKPAILALLAGERWGSCGVCLAGVDPAFGGDVGRVCRQAGCPYRGKR